MSVSRDQGSRQILDQLGAAIDQLEFAVSALGAAYELLTSAPADRLDSQLFRPIQRALGAAKRTESGFAAQAGLPTRREGLGSPGLPSQGVKSFIETASAAASEADRRIAQLQDSMLPIEFGDPELRAGLGSIRETASIVPAAARSYLRTLGR